MRLTTYTDYTLRTLMYLGVNPGRPATIAEVARAYGISQAHLMKVVHQLGTAGDIETTRGRSGGIRLARPAGEINLGAVVRRAEADLDLVPCFGDGEACAIRCVCSLRTVLNEALAAFLAVLDRVTLADLLMPRRGIAAALGLPVPVPAGAPGNRGAPP
jgi:Rrf2 family transcriptional regulator, nitric oxide-sensitive transcriptional repressor